MIITKQYKTFMDQIMSEQSQYIESLTKARDNLIEYNDERVKWAEFIIGMRQTPTS